MSTKTVSIKIMLGELNASNAKQSIFLPSGVLRTPEEVVQQVDPDAALQVDRPAFVPVDVQDIASQSVPTGTRN